MTTRAAVILATMTGLVLLAWRRRHLTVGWLWFLGTLVPVIGLVQVGAQSMADRYTYLPYLSACSSPSSGGRWPGSPGAAPCGGSSRSGPRRPSWPARPPPAASCATGKTAPPSGSVPGLDPKNYLAEFGLGNVAMLRGQAAEAEAHYAAALAVNPNLWLAHKTWDSSCRRRETGRGHRPPSPAARVNPRLAETQNQLGLALAARDGARSAVEPFRRATEAAPAVPRYRYNLAWALSGAGQTAEAEREYRSAREGDPGWPAKAADSAWRMATDPDPHRRNAGEACAWRNRRPRRPTSGRRGSWTCWPPPTPRRVGSTTRHVGAQALDLARDDPDLTAGIEKRLAGYRDHRPFRQGH